MHINMSNQLWRESTGIVSARSHCRVPVQINTHSLKAALDCLLQLHYTYGHKGQSRRAGT